MARTASRSRVTFVTVLVTLPVALATIAAPGCTGNREQSYGQTRGHAGDAKDHGEVADVEEARHASKATPARPHDRRAKPPHASPAAHNQPAASNEPAPNNLPDTPRPDIKYDPPFDQQPVATSKTANGVQIEDFVIGEGEAVTEGSIAKVHYTGYLTDGTIFDSSVKKGRPPHSFPLGKGRVIKGWDEGVVGMKRGGKRRLTIPPAMGYGNRRAGRIPQNATLVFTLELTGFIPPMPPPQPLSAFDGQPVAREKLENGLERIDYKIGTGPAARAGDTVYVHYRGTLTKDGTEFDNSHKRTPLNFQLGKGRVIKGWDQGIEGMQAGGLRKLQIPSELGYGERARGKIPANADLTFVLELMAVEPADEPPTKAPAPAGAG